MSEKGSLKTILNLIDELVSRLPNPPRESIKAKMQTLRRLIMESRPPQLMILGRRGAGKPSLINAMCGERVAATGAVRSQTGAPTWYSVRTENGELRILDTRGLGDRTRPESANFADCLDEIKAAVESASPDVILFLCKAKDVDSRIADDMANVAEIRSYVRRLHAYELPVAGVVTQVDELDPKRVEPPYQNAEKQRHIQSAVETMRDACGASQVGLMQVIPVSAYAEYEDGKCAYNNFWNVDVLVKYLVEVLPQEAQLQMARMTAVRSVQVSLARTVVGLTAAICGAIAATPIPVGDIVPITAAQIGMIVTIGYIAGRELTYDSAKEFLVAIGVNIGAAFVLREAARALVKFVFPGGGLLISAGVAAAGTWAIGEAAIAYFIEGKSIEEAKQPFDETRKKKTEEGPPHDASAPV